MAPNRVPPSELKSKTSADNVDVQELEAEAAWAEDEMHDVRHKLAEILPVLRRIHDHFTKAKRGSIRFRNCGSWAEYCAKRLHCTTDAIWLAEKRMRLGQVAQEQAKEERRQQRLDAKAEQSEAEWVAELNRNARPGVVYGGLTSKPRYSRPILPPHIPMMPRPIIPDVPVINTEPPRPILQFPDATSDDDEDETIGRAVPVEAVVLALAALDETIAMLTRVVANAHVDAEVLADAKRCVDAGRACAASIRKDFAIRDKAEVVTIEAEPPQIIDGGDPMKTWMNVLASLKSGELKDHEMQELMPKLNRANEDAITELKRSPDDEERRDHCKKLVKLLEEVTGEISVRRRMIYRDGPRMAYRESPHRRIFPNRTDHTH